MAEKDMGIATRIEGWLGWSHPPFHILGVAPFCLGTFLAWPLDGQFDGAAFALGLAAIALVMVAAYHAGEFIAHALNERSRYLFRHPFSGRSGDFPRLILHHGGLLTATIAMTAALAIGLVLQFGLQTGPFTILLGALGVLPGFVYAMRPALAGGRGLGEILIAGCYGWLPLAAAFYLQRGYIASCIHWMALPIGLSIFNVVLLSEFPHHAADLAAGKTNLLTRLGTAKGRALYGMIAILSWFCMYGALNAGIPQKALYIYFPVMALSAGVSLMMAGKRYGNPLMMEILIGANIAVHLGTVASYFLAFL